MERRGNPSDSVTIGEQALDQIKRLKQSAEPPHYEIWYNYIAGHNVELNRSVDGILALTGQLSDSDLGEIRRRFLMPVDATGNIDKIGKKIGDEVDQVIAMIEASVGSVVGFDTSLAEANHKLVQSIDRQTLRNIIEAVVVATTEMQYENSKLGASLKESRQDIAQLQANLSSVRMESLTDPLTSVANRRYFDQCLRTAVTEAERTSAPLSLLLADVDYFKKFNDDHGHQIGDHVLRLIAVTLKQTVKGQDLIARYGGEEFAIVLPDTPLREAAAVADNIRRAVAAKEIVKRSSGENLGRVTVSIGVACFHAGLTAQALIEAADKCLYAAKKNGRNCVTCENELGAITLPAV